MSDPYSWWRNALAGKPGPIHDGDPQLGFYRKRKFKGGPYIGAAIFPDPETGEIVALVDGKPTDASDIWTWVAKTPVTEDAYRTWESTGRWPDDAPAPIGHNAMPGDDPLEAIQSELAAEIETTAEFLAKPIEAQDAADRASVWAKRVGEIAKRADDERKREKEPHLAASRAVDDRWRSVIDDAKALTARLKKHVEPFLIKRKRAEEERARNAREEADRLRREAEEAANKSGHDRQNEVDRAELLRKAEEAERQATAKNANAGRTGARVALRTVHVAVITDFDACYAALKEHPDMKQFVQQLADRACRAKVPLAGVEYRAEERAA